MKYPSPQTRQNGFTLVEAVVAMAIFMIGFSGLYFLFNISQSIVTDSEKRMHLNLMADRIIQTIAAESQRSATDSLNPFVNPSYYSGDCAGLASSSTVVNSWCIDLDTNIGPINPTSGKEIRKISLVNDGTGLLIDISLVASDGRISTYSSRKLRQL